MANVSSDVGQSSAIDFKSMDLYNNDRSYFIERVMQNSFPNGFEGRHPFKSFRALDVMSYTRIDSSKYEFPEDYPFNPKIPTPEDSANTLAASDHELNILEHILPESRKSPDAEDVAILDVGCGYGGWARMLKIRYPHARVVGCEFQPIVRDLAKKLTAATSELTADSIEYWEPADANSLADVHEYLKTAADESYDAVTSFLAILHIPQKDKLFQELLRVLRPGGRIIFEDLIGTAKAEQLRKQPNIHVEAFRFSGDVPRTLQERHTGALVESKLIKLQRVVHFSDALTLHEYEDKLTAAGFQSVEGKNIVTCAASTWGMFVKDRSKIFAGFTPDTLLREMGVMADGTLGEAVQVPGVYGSDLHWNQWKLHQKMAPGATCLAKLRGVEGKTYTYLDPSRCPHNFTEPVGSIAAGYLECQQKFFQEVHELFNEDQCCGGSWVFAQKPDAADPPSPKRTKTE